MTTRAHENQKFHLPDGRVVGFAEYGSPQGIPLLYFHGYPSSRLEVSPAPIDEMARRHGIRLIGLDRPGFGLSSPQLNRRIIDWPRDVEDFAKGLKLPRFAVLGLSGGGPYALACAHAFPRDMLVGVGLFASAPPWVAGPHYMSLGRRMMKYASIHWPSGLRVFLDGCVGLARWLTRTDMVSRRIDGWLEAEARKAKAKKEEEEAKKEEEEAVPAKDHDPSSSTDERSTADRREDLLNILIGEPFAQGSEAATHEAKLLSADDWGFRFEDVEYNAVRIWHGAKDSNAPVVMIRYLAERLPHCVLKEFEGDTHYTMFKHLEGALKDLIPALEVSKHQTVEAQA